MKLSNVVIPADHIVSTKHLVTWAEQNGMPKRHGDIIRDFRNVVCQLEEGADLRPEQNQGFTEVFLPNGMTQEIWMNDELATLLTSGWNVKLRMAIIKELKKLSHELAQVKANPVAHIEDSMTPEQFKLYSEEKLGRLVAQQECKKLEEAKKLVSNELDEVKTTQTTPIDYITFTGLQDLVQEVMGVTVAAQKLAMIRDHLFGSNPDYIGSIAVELPNGHTTSRKIFKKTCKDHLDRLDWVSIGNASLVDLGNYLKNVSPVTTH